MNVRYCECAYCKTARRESAWVKREFKRVLRSARRKAKQLCHMGRYDEMPTHVSVMRFG
jgi:hypothetical protein